MYQLDGKENIEYATVMEKVLDAISNDKPVHYAFHWGVDIYWIDTPPPV